MGSVKRLSMVPQIWNKAKYLEYYALNRKYVATLEIINKYFMIINKILFNNILN